MQNITAGKRVYKSSLLVFLALCMFISLFNFGSLVVASFKYISGIERVIVLVIVFLAWLIFIVILAKPIKKNITTEIVVDGDGITCRAGKEKTTILWENIDRFVFDYVISSDKYYWSPRYCMLFEFGSHEKHFRFNRLITWREIDTVENIYHDGSFKKKACAFEGYGLFFKKKTSDNLVNDISSYSGRVPVREKGFFKSRIPVSGS